MLPGRVANPRSFSIFLEDLQQGMPAFVFTAGSLGDILATAGLVAQVVQVLYDNRDVSKECDNLAIELQSLQQILILTEYALQRYESTPLGGPLAHVVRPEVAQCHLSLKQFSENIDSFQSILKLTTISALWRRVVWAASDEANALREKLSAHRSKLTLLLISLHSVGLLDPQPSRLVAAQSHMQNSSSCLTRINDNTIEVVDLLGDTLPVSILFCSSWESFHHILKGYSANRIGQEYVERGDFEIVRPIGDQVIDSSDFPRLVREGETYEMSAVLRSSARGGEKEVKCPRCACIVSHIASTRAWTRCSHCSCRFNVDLYYTSMPLLGEEAEINKNEVSTNSQSSQIGQRGREEGEMADAKYFRRITLELQRVISSRLASSLLVNDSSTKSKKPARPSTRNVLQQALDLAQKAVQLDVTNKYGAAIDAYTKSAAIITGVLEKKAPYKQKRQVELQRLQNIRDTYIDRTNTIVSFGIRLQIY